MKKYHSRRRPETVRFGSAGLTDFAVTNEDKVPVQARGDYTGRLYVFKKPRWPVWVDSRDTATLMKNLKSAGVKLDDLAGTKVEERQEQLAKKRAKKKAAQEVTNAV